MLTCESHRSAHFLTHDFFFFFFFSFGFIFSFFSHSKSSRLSLLILFPFLISCSFHLSFSKKSTIDRLLSYHVNTLSVSLTNIHSPSWAHFTWQTGTRDFTTKAFVSKLRTPKSHTFIGNGYKISIL